MESYESNQNKPTEHCEHGNEPRSCPVCRQTQDSPMTRNYELGFADSEQTDIDLRPSTMTFEEFDSAYQQTMIAVKEKEKKGRLDPDAQPYEPLSEEEKILIANDWKEFSRQRGFSEEDIQEYEKWLVLSGQQDNLPGSINDPWRRPALYNYPKYIYAEHIKRAIADGAKIDEKVLSSYEQIKSELAQNASPMSSKSANGKVQIANISTDSHAEDVW